MLERQLVRNMIQEGLQDLPLMHSIQTVNMQEQDLDLIMVSVIKDSWTVRNMHLALNILVLSLVESIALTMLEQEMLLHMQEHTIQEFTLEQEHTAHTEERSLVRNIPVIMLGHNIVG